MPRQPPRAVRDAALGLVRDETYTNVALQDARQAWDAEQTVLNAKIDSLEHELKLAHWKRRHDRKLAINLCEKLAAYEENNPVGKLKRRDACTKHAKRIVQVLDRYDPADRAKLLMSALRISSSDGRDLREDILETQAFKRLLKKLHDARDLAIVKHLKAEVYTADAFSMLRLLIGMSKRECGLTQQCFKHIRMPDGRKRRFRLMTDSKQFPPAIFSLPEIVAYEKTAEEASQLELQGHADGCGADVAGKENSIDRVIVNELQFKHARHGGMATKGTYDDPHLWLITGDGAGLSAMYSGIRVGLVPGSTEYLNQSANDVSTILFYKVRTTLTCTGGGSAPPECAPFLCGRNLKRESRTRFLKVGSITFSPICGAFTTAASPVSSVPTVSPRGFSSKSYSARTSPLFASSTACSRTTPTASGRPAAAAATPTYLTSRSTRKHTTGKLLSRRSATVRMCPPGRRSGSPSLRSGRSSATAARGTFRRRRRAWWSLTPCAPSSRAWMRKSAKPR